MSEAVRALVEALRHRPSLRPAPERAFLRVASWNVLRGAELEGITAYLRETPGLSDFDVLLLNEVDLGMARSHNSDVAAELSEALGVHHVFGNSYVCLDLGDTRDKAELAAREDAPSNQLGLHGNAILSRHPIREARNVPILITRDKFHSSEKRLGAKRALCATIDTPLGPLPVATAHLDSIGSPAQRAAQLGDLLAATGPGRLLLGGDLNTTTYDLRTPLRLVWNVLTKALRGGFPHVIHQYMHPYERYEKPIFDVLEAAGLDWRSPNDLGQGSLRYEVGDFHSESAVTDHLPGFMLRYLRYKLRPWGGVAPLKLDWFATRGLRALAADELCEASGRRSLGPTVFPRPTWGGRRLSDHDPILVDLVFEG